MIRYLIAFAIAVALIQAAANSAPVRAWQQEQIAGHIANREALAQQP